MNPTTQQIPQQLMDLVRSEELMIATEKIAANHALRPEYYGALFRATVAVLKGELAPNGYVGRLTYELDVPQTEAVLIAQEVNRDIFNSVKDALKQLHSVGTGDASGAVATVPSPYNELNTPVAPAADAPEKVSAAPIPPRTFVMPTPTPSTTGAVAQVPTPASTTAPATLLGMPAPTQDQVASAALPQISAQEKISTPPTPPVKSVITPFPNQTAQPVMPPIPKPVAPQVAPVQPSPNNLEAKLGAAFTIKKDVMYTQQGAPAPIVPASSPTVPLVGVAPVAKPVTVQQSPAPVAPSVRPAAQIPSTPVPRPANVIPPQAPSPESPAAPMIPPPPQKDPYREPPA